MRRRRVNLTVQSFDRERADQKHREADRARDEVA
jgi:hypothetical protein